MSFERYLGTSITLQVALTDPDTGAIFDPTDQTLWSSIKLSDTRLDDEALAQTSTSLGGISIVSAEAGTVDVVFLPEATEDARPGVAYVFDVLAHLADGGRKEVYRDTVTFIRPVTRTPELSVPAYLQNPPAPFEDGKSAYELAVEGGFPGTQSEWLASLRGSDGAAGADGAPGAAGSNGQSAYELAVAAGFAGSQSEWLASLQGADGAPGANGTNGSNGKSAYELAVEGGFSGTQAEWLESLQGGSGEAVKFTRDQTAHSLLAGRVVRNTASGFAYASADTAANAQRIEGLVESVTANAMVVVGFGRIDTSTWATQPEANKTYFLDLASGQWADAPPMAESDTTARVWVKVFRTDDTGAAFVEIDGPWALSLIPASDLAISRPSTEAIIAGTGTTPTIPAVADIVAIAQAHVEGGGGSAEFAGIDGGAFDTVYTNTPTFDGGTF